jgi:hypothetical protein
MARTKQTLRRFQQEKAPVWDDCSRMLEEVCRQVNLPFPATKPADIITHLTRDWGVDLSHCKDFYEKVRKMYWDVVPEQCWIVTPEQPKKKRRVEEVSRPGSPTPAHKALTKDSSIQEVKSWALLLDVDKDIKEEISSTVQKQDVDGEFLFCLLDNLDVGGCADIIEVKKKLGLSAGAAYYLIKHLQCLKSR